LTEDFKIDECMKQLMGWALVAAIAATSACDDDNDNNNNALAQVDQDFVMNVSEANKAEIEAGQLATNKGTAQEVQDFGTQMVSEHSTALTELQTLATQKKATVASALNEQHQALKQKLTDYTGYTFDTAYVNSQVKDHQTAIAMFQFYQSNGKDADLKSYASKNLPHLQEHLAKAIQVKTTLDQAAPSGRKK
jgi:putative membrane protein